MILINDSLSDDFVQKEKVHMYFGVLNDILVDWKGISNCKHL